MAARVGQAHFAALFELRDAKLDGHSFGPATDGRHQGKVAVADNGWGMSSSLPRVGAVPLAVGPHVLTGTLRLAVYDGRSLDAVPFDPSNADPPGGLTTVDRPVAVSFAVCNAAHAPPAVVIDESSRAAVERAVTVRPFALDAAGRRFRTDVTWTGVPIRLIYRVWVRPAGGGPETPVGTQNLRPSQGTCNYVESVPAAAIGSADRVDVIFRPDEAAARAGTDPTPIWGGEVVVRDVPVVRH